MSGGARVLRRLRIPLSLCAGIVYFMLARPSSSGLFPLGIATAAAGEALRLWAAAHLRKDKRLAVEGPYAALRHPMYLGSLLIAAGACIAAAPSSPARGLVLLWGLAAAAFAVVFGAAAWTEEAHLQKLFAERWDAYSAEVPPFLPSPLRIGESLASTRIDWSRLRENRELTTLAAVAVLSILLGAKGGPP